MTSLLENNDIIRTLIFDNIIEIVSAGVELVLEGNPHPWH